MMQRKAENVGDGRRLGRAGELLTLPRLLLVLVCVLFLVGQASWIGRNQTIVGNDAGSHLVRSLEVHEALRHPGRAAIATIWGVSEHRPPFSYVSTMPFYWLFGVSYDAALWSNVLWLLLTGLAVYAVAARLGDEWDGVWSAALTLTVPLLFELTRLYYQEVLVTLLLWLALLALLASDGFGRRRASMLFGVAAGVGLLVKWTLPTFLVGPLALVLWHHRADWHPRLALVRGARWWLLGAMGGALCAWLFAPMVPSPLLLALFWILWTLLLAFVGLTLASTPTRTANLLLAGALALFVASLWYLPRADFAALFGELVFGDAGRPEEFGSVSLLDPATWLFYLRAVAWEQYGLVPLLAFPVALWGLRGEGPRREGVQGLLVALAGAWLIFTVVAFRHSARVFAPILPAIAVLTVLGLRRLRPSLVGGALLAVVVLWQAAQFGLLTFGPGEALARPLQARRLVTGGGYQYWPDSGPSDAAYHVAPALLDILRREPTEDGRVFLSLLVNEPQLHQNTLRTEFEMLAPGLVRVVPLTKEVEEPYTQLFRAPFVLYKDGGPTDGSPQSLAAIERLVADESGLFRAAFDVVWERPTPTGERLVLARRRHALAPLSMAEVYEPLMAQLRPWLAPGDRAVIDNPAQVNPLGAFGWPETPVLLPPPDAREGWLAGRLAPGQRLFAILWNQTPTTEPWLDANLVRGNDWWFGDTHLIAYVVPSGKAARTFASPGTLGAETLREVTAEQAGLQPDGALTLALAWEVAADEAVAYRTVVELYAADGTLLAMRDLPPEAPWQAGSRASQRTALLLPHQLGPVPACLLVARYDPATGQRLLTASGEDHLVVECGLEVEQ